MGVCSVETSSNCDSNTESVKASSNKLQRQLTSAFGSFQSISDRLTKSYIELEHQVQELQFELLKADRDREQQQSAKDLLAEQLDLVVGLMPVAVLILDGKGVISQVNAFAEELIGTQLMGKPWINIIAHHFSPRPDDGHEISLKNGRLVSIATQSLSGNSGQIIVLNDQTETRNLQARLNHNKKLSEMGKMTASLGHQIRTPLATASLYAERVGSEHLTEVERVKYASKIKRQLTHLEKQVQDMLVFSKAGIILNTDIQAHALSESIQYQIDELSRQKSAVVHWTATPGHGRLRCNTDLLMSVISNLVENSIEACTGSGVTPEISVSIQEDKSRFLNIEIEDNGPGIGEDIVDRISEPFFTTKSSGTGLGLAVAGVVIDAHGGCFDISNCGQKSGALAKITLPLVEVQVESGELQ